MIVCWITDLIFASKVRATAAELGLEVEFVRDTQAFLNKATAAQKVVVDLRTPGVMDVLTRLRDTPTTAKIARIGFIDHVQGEIMTAAQKLGCVVYSKGEFSRALPQILAS